MSRWIPLESNPEVLNKWATKAGLRNASFADVYGLEEGLLAMVPQPAKAIVLLFPITPASEAKRKQEEEEIEKNGQLSLDPTLLWIKQTISNACGTMGLIHAIANSDVTIAPMSPLAKFIDECSDKTPDQRAKLLETTPLFGDIHAEAASGGQSAVPTDLDTNLHFTCFVEAPAGRGPESEATGMRLVELDGRRKGPVDRGECTDFLKDVAKVVQEVYIKGGPESLQFSMMSLGPPDQ
ncbi:Ubiquitin carboxyl-terminal hydrolase [Mycena indigotica]|uniref:Ubiquitin carboxyl-terminal hydrolase n=1 Tax=Mycena indigotica TaxID=2126181 RepID=A0A8H6W8H2_9AGAR|nr:Ubiquitin carboxyl-terminal hydrolase [Mycena indigotica]KAF7309659.1 Ubiquitin carboxyl-terminal hydrolase [Mycena indigotica]